MEIKEQDTDFNVSVDIGIPQSKSILHYASLATAFACVLSPGQCLQLQHPTFAVGFSETSGSLNLETEVNHIGEVISFIKENWQFNMTELAEIFGVSRPTVYNWLKGKTPPDKENLQRLQVIAAGGRIWAESTHVKNLDYILDYTGPNASEITIRDHLKSSTVTKELLQELIPLRIQQYQTARETTRKIIGEPPSPPDLPIPNGTRILNELWAENAKRLHHLHRSDS